MINPEMEWALIKGENGSGRKWITGAGWLSLWAEQGKACKVWGMEGNGISARQRSSRLEACFKWATNLKSAKSPELYSGMLSQPDSPGLKCMQQHGNREHEGEWLHRTLLIFWLGSHKNSFKKPFQSSLNFAYYENYVWLSRFFAAK